MAIRVNVRQSATLAKNHKKYMAIIGEMEMASFNDEVPRWLEREMEMDGDKRKLTHAPETSLLPLHLQPHNGQCT